MAIRIDTESLTAKIEELKEQQKIIAEVLEEFKGDTLIMDNYWSGETGDTVKEKLLKYATAFDMINLNTLKYIHFLEGVAEGYSDEDNMIFNQIDLAAGTPIESSNDTNEQNLE